MLKYLVASFMMIAGLGAAQAQNQMQTSKPDTAITIEEPWVRVTPEGARVAGGFAKIRTEGEKDMLIGVSSEIAERMEIHESITENGIAKMRPVSTLSLEKGKPLILKPGGLHLMFINLKRAVKEGDTVPVRVMFDKAGPMDVSFKARPLGDSKEEKSDEKDHMKGHGGH